MAVAWMKDHRILVYTYLENNSLAQTLIGGSYSSIQFSWRTRTRICIGIARGLTIRHEEVRPHIVHRDIKACNILLNKDLTPKISDFGIPKLIPANMTHVSTRVAGTIALVADGGCLLVCCRCAAAKFCWAAAAAAVMLL